MSEVKEQITCYKCTGTGYLPGFAHVAQGVCFDCKGTGKRPASSKNNKGYSRAFINSLMGQPDNDNLIDDGNGQLKADPYFPLNKSGMRLLEIISNIGHPTAECQVLVRDGIYYVGQPVCRSSTWWRVPADQWEEFKKHFNKCHKGKPGHKAIEITI